MAVTVAEVQAALSDTSGKGATIIMSHRHSLKERYYVIGGCDAPGRDRWCECTTADDAATQAASILTQLRA